jgi:serine/threonine-protein kinase
VCTVHEVGEDNGQAYIVMEYVEGRPLSEALARGLLPDAVVRYGIQIADALAHAHDRGIVHRDLKTHNVIVTPEGRAKVLDFGLAKRLAPDELSEEPTRAADSLTEAGQIVGTLHYLAPEVLRGRAADTRTDVWAPGVLLYELATGDRPFRGQTKFEVTSAILEQPPRPLPESVPAGLRSVIERCLAKEPAERYQRGSEVRAVLEAIQSGSFTPEQTQHPKTGRRRWLLWGAAAAAVLALGLAGARFLAGRAKSIDSIAVLPFVNVGDDPETEYLSDGVTESVIGSLSRMPKLKVIAFSSVLRYKGKTVDPQEVARELPVAAILTGRILQRGNDLSITTELVDTRDRSRLWGEQYDQKATNLLAVQDDIAQKISEHLRQRLTGEEQGRLKKRYTDNAEAYQLYLKGRHHWDQQTPEGYEKSLEYFQQAIDKDPNYALAYTGIANTFVAMTIEGLLPPKQGQEQAQAAIAKAFALDDTLAEAHQVMAVATAADWRWPAAEKEFRRALELNPALISTRRYYAMHLRNLGRWEQAIHHYKKELELDPLSVETNTNLGQLYSWAKRCDEAIEQFHKTLEIDPNASGVHDALSDVLARKRLFPEALAAKRRSLVLAGDDEAADTLGTEGTADGYQKGIRALARKHLTVLEDVSKEAYVSPMAFAQLHTILGEKDRAFAWLEKAYEERSPWVAFLANDPGFETLRPDPRFAELVRRVGFGS